MNVRSWRSVVLCVIDGLVLCAVGGLVLPGGMPANAQITTPATTTNGATTSASTTVHVIRGRVLNALDGSVVPRALVTINARAVLTDPQGRFEFPEYAANQAYVLVRKPGFSANPDNPNLFTPTRLTDLDTPIDLKLYPDAIISGIVAATDGTALGHISVQLRRRMFDQNGMHWQVVKSVQTNSRGEYRFRETAGRFQITTSYVARSPETGEAVLPKTVPERGAGDEDGGIVVAIGQQKRLDIRPRMSPTFPVPVQLEPAESQRGIQFLAKTTAGEVFNAPSRFDSNTGISTVTLPTGSFTLTARSGNGGDRGHSDAAMTGSLKVTVTPRGSEGGVMHLSPMASIPVEVAVDPLATTSNSSNAAATSALLTVPNPQQLNLRLHNMDEPDGMFSTQDVSLQQVDGGKFEFHVAPGRYRLMTYGSGQWYVESATYGVTSAMSSEIVIGTGSTGGTPIRLVVNNIQGTVKVTVNVPVSATAWVYLLPRTPSIAPLNPVSYLTNLNGNNTVQTRVPVGSYTPIALDHQATEDLRIPEILAKYSTGGKTVDVTAATTTTVTLDLALEKAK